MIGRSEMYSFNTFCYKKNVDQNAADLGKEAPTAHPNPLNNFNS